MQKIYHQKKFHIIFLRKFSHAFSQFHQKSRFIGYLLHSSCYFIEYYYYYHQKKKYFYSWGQVILILKVQLDLCLYYVSSNSIERLTVFSQSCLKHLCISLSLKLPVTFLGPKSGPLFVSQMNFPRQSTKLDYNISNSNYIYWIRSIFTRRMNKCNVRDKGLTICMYVM